jgi:hypothetical protein
MQFMYLKIVFINHPFVLLDNYFSFQFLVVHTTLLTICCYIFLCLYAKLYIYVYMWEQGVVRELCVFVCASVQGLIGRLGLA